MKHLKLFENFDQSYRDKAIVNKIIISVGYDSDYRDYTLYFPQIEFNHDERVADQVLRISEDPEVAKQYFEKAKQLANDLGDVYQVYVQLKKERDYQNQ